MVKRSLPHASRPSRRKSDRTAGRGTSEGAPADGSSIAPIELRCAVEGGVLRGARGSPAKSTGRSALAARRARTSRGRLNGGSRRAGAAGPRDRRNTRWTRVAAPRRGVVRLSTRRGHAPRHVRAPRARPRRRGRLRGRDGPASLGGRRREDALRRDADRAARSGGVDDELTRPPPARADGRWAISPDGDIVSPLTAADRRSRARCSPTSVLVGDARAARRRGGTAAALSGRSRSTSTASCGWPATSSRTRARAERARRGGRVRRCPPPTTPAGSTSGAGSRLKIPDATHDGWSTRRRRAPRHDGRFGSKTTDGRRTRSASGATRRALKEKLG